MELLRYIYHPDDAASGTMARYFYHPDHIESSSWITDGTGQAIQHLHYLPFGEDWVDQRNSTWNAPFTFSGKEKDLETGYGYFGARYYDSGLSIWLSVDPMSDKYPSMSPYNYCANNPVILVDPDGREIGDFFDLGGNHIGSDSDPSNNLVYFVSNPTEVERIRTNTANNQNTDPSAADIAYTCTRFDVTATVGVYNRAMASDNGGNCEEGAMVLSQANNANRIKPLPRGDCGANGAINFSPAFIGAASTFIHSHIFNIFLNNNGATSSSTYNPSQSHTSNGRTPDSETFVNFPLNIILGKKYHARYERNFDNSFSWKFSDDTIYANFCNSRAESIFIINISTLIRINQTHPAPDQ